MADGRRIRKVSIPASSASTRSDEGQGWNISTVAGANPRKSQLEWHRPNREGWQSRGTDLVLEWPTEIDVNPLDDSLVIVDQGRVIVLTRDGVAFPLGSK